MSKHRYMKLSACGLAILRYIWNIENEVEDPPFEANYAALAKWTGFSSIQIKRTCPQLVESGLLTRTMLSPFGRRGRSRIVFRIPYGQFQVIKETISAGDKAKPFIISMVRRSHNPISRSEVSRNLNLSMRSTQRRIAELKSEGKLAKIKVKEWTGRKGWTMRTMYRLTTGAKHKPLTEWMENYEQWRKQN